MLPRQIDRDRSPLRFVVEPALECCNPALRERWENHLLTSHRRRLQRIATSNREGVMTKQKGPAFGWTFFWYIAYLLMRIESRFPLIFQI